MTEHPDAERSIPGQTAPGRLPRRADGARGRPGGDPPSGAAPQGLERLTRLIDALNEAAERLEESAGGDALAAVVGDGLRAVGIECQVAILEMPDMDMPDTAQPASRDATIDGHAGDVIPATGDAIAGAGGEPLGPPRVIGLSIPSGLRRAIELLIGRPLVGIPFPPNRVAVIRDVFTDRRAHYLADTHDTVRQALPWVSVAAVHQLVRLARARTAIFAPLISRGHVVGVLNVWADDLRPEDATALGAFGRQAGIALENARPRAEMARPGGRLIESERRAQAPELLEAVFDAEPGGIGVLEGPDGIIRKANPRLMALSARPDLDPIGRSVHEIFPPEATSLFTDLPAVLARARLTWEPVILSDLAVREVGSGVLRTLTVHIVPIAPRKETASRGAEDDNLLFIVWDSTARTRAELDLEAQVRRAETLAGVALALGQSTDVDTLLSYIAQAARDLTNADAAGFLLRDSPEERFRAAATAGVSAEILPAVRRLFVADLRTLRPLLTEGQPLRIADAQAAAPRVEARLLARGGVRSLAAAPVVGAGEWMLGALVVGQREPGAFTAEHADLLAALAAQAAAAVERARALEEARRRAGELEATFASMIEGVAIYDLGGVLVRMNAAGERITRRSLAPGEGPDVRRERFGLRRADGGTMSRAETPSERAVRGETFTSVDYLVDGEDGPETVISVSGAPLRAQDGTVSGGVVIFRNVTALRRLERRTHRALDALLGMAGSLVAASQAGAAVGEAIHDHATHKHATHAEPAGTDRRRARAARASTEAGLDPHGTLREICRLTTRVLDCDRVSIGLLDTKTGVLVPAAVADLTPTEDADGVAPRVTRGAELERGGPVFGPGADADLAQRLRAGESVVVDTSRSSYRDLPNTYGAQSVLVVPMHAGGDLLGVAALNVRPGRPGDPDHVYTADEIALARGIAQLAALAVEREGLERVAAEVEALRTANALKEEFLSIASHELKTPLTVLQARTQATQRRLLRMGHTEAAAQFSGIQAALTRMLSLVEELLNATRIEAGRLDLRPEPCDLGTLVVAAVDEQREIADRELVMEVAGDTGTRVEGDPERLTQVLTNLLANAVKYSPADSPIRVRVARETGPMGADEVVVSVTDHGVGIPSDEIAHVFERFYRASTSSARQYGGLGLGLHIAATIMERHGGRIWAESPGPGQGSTFTIALPALAHAAEVR